MSAQCAGLALCRGYIVPEYYKFDGFLSPSNNLKFSDVPNGLKAGSSSEAAHDIVAACMCRGSQRRAEGGLGPDPGIRGLLGARCQQEDLRARPSLKGCQLLMLLTPRSFLFMLADACRQFWQGQSGTRSHRFRQLRPGPCPQASAT